MLENMFASNVDRSIAPPAPIPSKKWSMIDSGSQPTVADCPTEFPQHKVYESAGSKAGLQYRAANNSLIPNEGEVHIKHREADGQIYDFTFQHAKVHCPIVSVKEPQRQHDNVSNERMGLFVLLQVLPPDTSDMLRRHRRQLFSRHGKT